MTHSPSEPVAILICKAEDPESGATRENLPDRMVEGTKEALRQIGAPRHLHFSIVVAHDDGCPAEQNEPGDFTGCSCEYVKGGLFILSDDELKVAMMGGKLRRAEQWAPAVDPGSAN